jgi:hypothetical protein
MKSTPFIFSIATSIRISLDYKSLLTILIAKYISYQIIIATKNSKSPNSFVAKDLASLLILESKSFYNSSSNTSLKYDI